MKKMPVILLALLLLCACAKAQDMTSPRPGIAVAAPGEEDGTAPLYALPDEDSDVLMGYYRGAVLEVISLEAGGMVRVQSGVEGAGITGYMKRSDLRYGELAMRELPPYTMKLRMCREATVYAYPDEQSGVIWQLEEGDSFVAKGIGPDGWVQIDDTERLFFRTGNWLDGMPDSGFVQLESMMSLATFEAEPGSWYILPAQGELTAAQALDRAIEYAIGFDEDDTRIPAAVRTRESLEAFRTDVRLVNNEAYKVPQWEVYMEDENGENGFSIYLTIDGELVRIEESNG